jgi:hypothetical protein
MGEPTHIFPGEVARMLQGTIVDSRYPAHHEEYGSRSHCNLAVVGVSVRIDRYQPPRFLIFYYNFCAGLRVRRIHPDSVEWFVRGSLPHQKRVRIYRGEVEGGNSDRSLNRGEVVGIDNCVYRGQISPTQDLSCQSLTCRPYLRGVDPDSPEKISIRPEDRLILDLFE